MRSTGLFLFLTLFILLNCSDDDHGPTNPVPVIESRSLTYIEGDKQYSDTLKLTFYFADGDMDLGLDDNEIDPPYHTTNYFLADGKGDTTKVGIKTRYPNLPPLLNVKSGARSDLITYRTRTKPGYDFLPPYEMPYRCTTYRYESMFISVEDTAVFKINDTYLDRIIHSDAGYPDVYVLVDTFYYEANPHSTNMKINFLVESGAGNFEVFEMPSSPNQCSAFPLLNLRFPRLTDLRPRKKISNGAFTAIGTGTRQGDLTYKFTSVGIKALFGGKRIKMRVTLEDRALNLSNTIETEAIEIPSP